MKEVLLNSEGIQVLREIGERELREVPSDEVLQAVVSSGLVDLDRSAAAVRGAVRKIDELSVQVKSIRETILMLDERQSDTDIPEILHLGARIEDLLRQIRDLGVFVAIGSHGTARALFSFVQEVQGAVRNARGYVEGRTFVLYYQLAFLERFVLPAMEGRLTPEWSADDIWKQYVTTQITQRLHPMEEIPSRALWDDFKKELSPGRLHNLVGAIGTGEKCNAVQLGDLVPRLREKAMAEKWPAEYLQ